MQNDLKWKSHVQDIVKKASEIIYFVRACKKANLPSNIGLQQPIAQRYDPYWNMRHRSGLAYHIT